ncbi:MotA/TolQ/ExbB proton channel family protein [Aeoliella sp. ICT_H6.2]|uniref:MotA/TolQ/ExbB proton channel family protein n=1 Tax=Aeoliella straminimaris TaxID=2954799 RepID=A0A9X2F8I7_9BACT|nr:MotA/TolQ/ExbB proton channel family protein [Aeoliella straminimaris]
MSRIASASEWLLRSPLIWGGMASMFMYALLKQDIIHSPLLDRYLMGHWIEVGTTVLFFIAMAAIAFRALSLIPQNMVLERTLLEPPTVGGQPTSDAPRLAEQLDDVPPLLQETYLVRRLRAALEFVRRKDSAETLDKQLHHLEEVDLDRMSSGYALVRVVLWAVPSLGFLGTVIGIAAAIGHLSFDADNIVESLKQVIPPLTSAFDTTTLSLALSIPIMFSKFVVERMEQNVLEKVDARTEEELVGRFFEYGSANDPQVAAVRRMAEQVVRTVEAMSTRQGQILQDTIEESHRHWADITSATGKLLDESLQATLHDSLERHAQTLTSATDRQVQALEHLLGHQLSAMNTNIEKQIGMLNDGVQRNVNAIENGVVNRMGLVDDVFAKQIGELENMVNKQVEVLSLAIQSQADMVQQGTGDLIGRLRDGLERMAELLVEALHKHGETLTRSEEELAQENRRHLSEVEAALGEAMVLSADRQEKLVSQSERMLKDMQAALVDAAGATVEQQQQLVRQGDILLKVVDATGQVKQLEETLNQNLATLGRTHNFEETLLSLSAAIQLLSARMGRDGVNRPHVEFDGPSTGTPASHAA